MKNEPFLLSNETVSTFCKANAKHWQENEKPSGKIQINLSMVRMVGPWIIPKLLFAKGIEKATNCRSYVLVWKPNPYLEQFVHSFGVDYLAIEALNHRHFFCGIKAVFVAMHTILFKKTGDALKTLQIADVDIGMDLYEDIIRTSDLSTITSLRNKTCLRKLIHLLWSLYTLDRYYKKNQVKYAVCDDVAYHEAAIEKLLRKYDVSMWQSNNTSRRKLAFDDTGRQVKTGMYMHQCIAEVIDQPVEGYAMWSLEYLNARFSGLNGRDIDRVAFKDKSTCTKQELISQMGLNPKKKTVVIMAHTFTDAVYNYGNIYFRDYYDWLEKTLACAETVDDVNWVLKPHPTRSVYNESKDSIEAMYERHKKNHIHMLSDSVSAASIKEIADVLVTIGGNAGAEFSCFGIPTVIVGKPYYGGFGYTIEPQSYSEYVECLKGISSVEALTEEQTDMARKVFFWFNNREENNFGDYTDVYASLNNRLYQEMISDRSHEYFVGSADITESHNAVMEKITSYFSENDMSKCEYYLAGTMVAD